MSETDLGTRKTVVVLVVVVACFAVLWPKVFYPMMVGPPHQHQKAAYERGCCDVISDVDVNTIKIMSELCSNIIEHSEGKPLLGKEVVIRCRAEVLNKCGIDISAVLQEQVRLGHSFKQIVDAVRSFNGSLCLKYHFGLSPSRLGVPHRVTVNVASNYLRQERPAHLRPEMLHPALREKGRAIPQPYQAPTKGPTPKFVQGRPGPIPAMRPPMGAAAGHVVPQQKGLNSMGVIMPLYTVGIVIFFSYTLIKLLFKKKPEGPGGDLYPPVEPSPTFRNEVFESQKNKTSQNPNTRDAEMDQLRRRLRETELAMERIVSQMAQVPLRSQKANASNGVLYSNGSAKKAQDHEQPSVKVLGMEMSASREGGKKWKRPESPIIPSTPPPPPIEPAQEIFLEGALPAQSQLLVSDTVTETELEEDSSSADPTVILASKMTLSVISLDSLEDGGANKADKELNGQEDDVEDENVDESKYTTASCTTAAEQDISEDEETDDEEIIEDEVENGPKILEIETEKPTTVTEIISKEVEDDEEVEEEEIDEEEEVEEIEEIEEEEEEEIEEQDDDNTDEMDNLELDEEVNEDDVQMKQDDISNVIDDIISTGTQIAADRERTATEKVTEDTPITNLQSDK